MPLPAFLRRDPSQAIVLAGSGRSGTTWLGNIIAASPHVDTIFEPLDRRRVPEAGSLPLRPYARREEESPQLEAYLRQVLRGRVSNEWVNRAGRRPWGWRTLVKTIRGTLLLDWIDRRYRPRIVYMVRHPAAVVLSRMKLGWDTHLDELLAQPTLVANYLEPHLDRLNGLRQPLEEHAALWAVENLVPLRQLPKRGWVFCTYEQLVAAPEAQSRRILRALGLRFTPLHRRALARVSPMVRAESAILQRRDPLRAWQDELKPAEVAEILTIVHDLGVTLYDEDPVPHLERLELHRPVLSTGAN